LVVLRGSTPGDTLILEGQRITVGRDASCDLFLDDITVSRKHAEIQSEEASGVTVWFVQDTDSLNGTYLNREVISQRTQLTSGDELQFGKFKFTFLLPEESE
jgi:pSer/pThr/pTyr-binding forkhead associated (FHA) protein